MGVGWGGVCFLAAQIQADLAFSGVPNWFFFYPVADLESGFWGYFCAVAAAPVPCVQPTGESPRLGESAPDLDGKRGKKRRGEGQLLKVLLYHQ